MLWHFSGSHTSDHSHGEGNCENHQESISLRTIIATPNKIHFTPLIKFKRIMDIESIQARTGNMHNIKCLVTRGNRKRYMKII
jgi:hypothetical protein